MPWPSLVRPSTTFPEFTPEHPPDSVTPMPLLLVAAAIGLLTPFVAL